MSCEEPNPLVSDRNIWNDINGAQKDIRKNIRLVLKTGKVQLGRKHRAFKKGSSSSEAEPSTTSPDGSKVQEVCRKQGQNVASGIDSAVAEATGLKDFGSGEIRSSIEGNEKIECVQKDNKADEQK